MKPKFLERFPTSPDLLPFMLDSANDSVTVIQLSQQQFREASFLDQRIIKPQIPRGSVQWDDLAESSGQTTAKPDFIFHIGHVGSTLISRLFGELENTHALREPLLLRNLAEIGELNGRPHCSWSPEKYQTRLKQAIIWLSRTYQPSQTALIKASSFVSAIAADIRPHIGRAIALYVPPRRYIATIMAGEASRQELAHLSGQRLTRLHSNIDAEPLRLWDMDAPMRAAMSWATEMTSLVQAFGGEDSDDVKWINFDTFLQDPQESLSQITGFFGYKHDAAQITSLVNGPVMRQYSKAPEHDYSADLRAELLREAETQYAGAITEAMNWLDEAGSQYPLLGKALETGGT